jgi:hypothetical protein
VHRVWPSYDPGLRVGEVLLRHGWVDWETLALALGDQPASGMRLCSLLVSQRKVDFDHASRALGEQHGTAAVLRHHLERRDKSLAALLPATLARAEVAIPIGRLGTGTLIVCVRDPSERLRATLVRSLREEIVLAVAPARYIERLVVEAYAERSDTEIAVLDAELVEDDDDDVFDVEVEASPAPVDDLAIDIEVTAPAAANRALPVAFKPVAAKAPARDSLDAALAACKNVDEPDWLFDVTSAYLTAHWSAWLLLAIRDPRAVGIRGSGKRLKPGSIKTFVVTLEDANLVRMARDERRTVDEVPAEPGSEHEVIAGALDHPASLAAAPLAKGTAITHVLLVGDPVGAEREDSLVDLGLLVETMTEALSRM